MAFMPGTFDVWAIFLIQLNYPLPWILLAVILLRFPERRLQKRYERIFMALMATWLLSFQAISAVTFPPPWATPKNVAEWPWWIYPTGHLGEAAYLSDVALLAVDWGPWFSSLVLYCFSGCESCGLADSTDVSMCPFISHLSLAWAWAYTHL
jgi:hypothetical protein